MLNDNDEFDEGGCSSCTRRLCCFAEGFLSSMMISVDDAASSPLMLSTEGTLGSLT